MNVLSMKNQVIDQIFRLQHDSANLICILNNSA